MQITCPACTKVSNSKADIFGKSVKCSCGHSFVVPNPSSPPTSKRAGGSIAVTCECGKSLRVSEAVAGKSVKCPCGKAVKVPAAKSQAIPTTQATAVPAARIQAAKIAPVSQPANLNPFHALTDDDWQGFAAKAAPPQQPEESNKPSATNQMLSQARDDLGEKKKSVRTGAGGHLSQSRWILIGIGALKLAITAFQFTLVSALASAIVEASPDENLDEVLFILKIILGFGIATSVCLIVMGIFIFLLPMTCTIAALVLFILLEIVSFAFNPFLLVNIRAWIIRMAMFGALVQAINNAAYYKFVKTGARDA